MTEIRVCPRCGSKDIVHDSDIISMITNPSNHVCNDCGFKGLAVEIQEEDHNQFLEDLDIKDPDESD